MSTVRRRRRGRRVVRTRVGGLLDPRGSTLVEGESSRALGELLDEGDRRRKALARILGEIPLDDTGGRWRELARSPPAVRPLAGEQLACDDGKGVPVARRRRRAPGQPLGGEVARRAHKAARRGQTRPCELGAREAEVCDPNLVLLVEQQVRRLHVPVHDPLGVRRVERLRGLRQPGERASLVGNACADPVRERSALDQLHHDERAPLPLADVVDRDDAPSRPEPRCRAGFAQEALPEGIVLGERL